MTCSSVVILDGTMQKAQVVKLGLFAFEFFNTANKTLIRNQRLATFILITLVCCIKEIFLDISHAAHISL